MQAGATQIIPPAIEMAGTVIFVLAVLHTFFVSRFNRLAHRFPPGSIAENLCHFLGEVEVVFGIWAGLLVGAWALYESMAAVISYLESLSFAEPAFVFVIMCMAATRPTMDGAERIVRIVSSSVPLPGFLPRYITLLVMGPLLGSLITEPAAMTLTALLLRDSLFAQNISNRLRYMTLGLLFVNISIGGTLTHFAAPPVVMVANRWQWDTPFMLAHFGWKAAIALCFSTALIAWFFRKELSAIKFQEDVTRATVPWWMTASHLLFMFFTVIYSHHMALFVPLFLFFLGWTEVTKEHQTDVRIREGLLVGFFLGGLVTLGGLQSWWLSPLLTSLGDTTIFWCATALTAVTDNAALTYLGSLVPSLPDTSRYALVAGAVAGGGLTVIANAPNPAGYVILSPVFGEDGIRPLLLFLASLVPTAIAAAAFLLL